MLKSLRTVVGGLAIIVGVSLVVAGAHRIIMGRADFATTGIVGAVVVLLLCLIPASRPEDKSRWTKRR